MDCMGKTLIGLDFIIRGGVFLKKKKKKNYEWFVYFISGKKQKHFLHGYSSQVA